MVASDCQSFDCAEAGLARATVQTCSSDLTFFVVLASSRCKARFVTELNKGTTTIIKLTTSSVTLAIRPGSINVDAEVHLR